MRSRPALLMALILAALPLAGCFGATEIAPERTFSASGGKASAGWAYDGVGVAPAAATLEGRVNHVDNTGSVTAAFDFAGSRWTITFEQFEEAAGRDFMSGGVAFDLVEHGDTGVADASIPKILALVAAWGKATVTRDGAPVTGASGDALWSAHLMVSDTTVRGADGKITKADGTTPYDPATPADARRIEGTRQAFLFVKSPDGEDAKRADVPVTASAAFFGPEATQVIDVAAEKGSSVLLNVTADGGATPLAVGQVSFRLVDADGNEVASNAGGNVVPNAPVTATLEAENVVGPLRLEITGTGSFTARVEGAVSYSDWPFIVLTWDSVTLE